MSQVHGPRLIWCLPQGRGFKIECWGLFGVNGVPTSNFIFESSHEKLKQKFVLVVQCEWLKVIFQVWEWVELSSPNTNKEPIVVRHIAHVHGHAFMNLEHKTCQGFVSVLQNISVINMRKSLHSRQPCRVDGFWGILRN